MQFHNIFWGLGTPLEAQGFKVFGSCHFGSSSGYGGEYFRLAIRYALIVIGFSHSSVGW